MYHSAEVCRKLTGRSSGFELGAAVALARGGETMIASMRNLAKAQKLREAAGTAKLDLIQLDVTDVSSREAAVAAATTKYGRIDVLINNAGIFSMGAAEALGETDLRALFETNVFGTFALTTLVLPAMCERRSGRIVNVTSPGAAVHDWIHRLEACNGRDIDRHGSGVEAF